MRRPWSVLLLLVGALLLLASLYLPWQETSFGEKSGGLASGELSGLPNLFARYLTLDGWSSEVGQAAALSALLLVPLAAIAFARPNLVGRLPLGRCGLFVGYFGLAVGLETRSIAHQRELGLKGVHFHYAYGSYPGIVAGILVLLAAGATRRGELVRYRSASRLAPLVLVVGLLVAFLLPWERSAWPGARVTSLGVANPAAVAAAALALWLPVVWWRPDSAARPERLVFAAVAALFTAAAVRSLSFPADHAYGAWVGLGLAVALLALALIDAAPLWRWPLPQWHALATGAAAALFVTGLFLPWQKGCYTRGSGFGLYSGRCLSDNGWTTTAASAAAVLVIALAIVTLAPRRLAASVVELAAAVGLVVATLGFQLEESSGPGFRLEFGYGSTIGYIGAALLVALALVRLRLPAFDWNRVPVRLAPIAACAAYLVIVVLPWWDVLPRHLQSALRFAPVSWLTIVGALIGIRLLRLWARQIADALGGADWLVHLPLALLALAAVDLIRLRDDGITWGGGVVVGLCLLLALLGRIEQREGLHNLRVPEILRVDRL